MKIEKIKPIPKYILARIKKRDEGAHIDPKGKLRFYSYLATNDKELVKVTVAVKMKGGKWYCKQCAVHGIHSEECFLKDIVLYYGGGGYQVGWYAEGLAKRPEWYEGEEWGEQEDGLFDPFAPVVNKEYIAKYPEYKYSALEFYKGVDVLQYLRIYEKYPQAEYLVKLGLWEYAKNERLLKMAGEDKKFQKWLSANRRELSRGHHYITSILQAYQQNKSLKETQAYERAKISLRERAYKPIREMLNGDYKRYFEYISKQNITNRLYLDYLNACNYLGLDMTEEKNRFPRDFKHWHDVRIDEYATAKALKDEEERKELYAKFAVVANKYLPLQDEKKGEFIAIIAKSPAELIREGAVLGHCVGRMNYDQKFIREETLIFFIRSRECPEIPFATVEYSPKKKKVLQYYAKGNTTPDNAAMHYVNDVWLPYANRALNRIAV